MYAVKGDFGYGSAEQRLVTKAMCETRKVRPFDVVITTGDNFYRPDGMATPANHDVPEACLNAHPGHRWLASYGNHDASGRSTKEVLGVSEPYYTFSEGEIQLFILDSNRVMDASQLSWLESQLKSSSASWKVVVFHHPPYTVGGHPPDESVRTRWVPLFIKHGVRLVLNGHNHGYEHSRVGDIDYVVTAGGGAPLYPCLRGDPNLISCKPRHHFLIMEVTSERISVEAIGPDQLVFDSFVVE